MTEGIVTLHTDRDKSIRRGHPWIFSGAIEKARGAVPGETVTVVDQKGQFLARGYWNPKSQIQVRLLTWQDEAIDDDWWRRALARAAAGRSAGSTATRLVNAENDFIPGLVVDRYQDWLVLQAQTLYIDRQKQRLAALLQELFQPQGIYERSDIDVRGKEGLKAATGTLAGADVPALIEIEEDGCRLLVDVRGGHKTGFYLDQRPNRRLLYDLLATPAAAPRRLLNLFSYTGGFGLQALRAGGVQVVNVDSSGAALALARQALALNAFASAADCTQVEADCFEYLRQCQPRGDRFDVIVCDPPKFAHNAGQVDKAARGYKDLNLNAFKLLQPGGWLLTFSCSGAINRDLFQKIVFGALDDSGRQAQVLRHLGAADDHPTALSFPEGDYLKGLLLRVY
ncbi:MAG: class I SAM-dependent rRNA methyltransferase [Anaerolineae bacterium]|nr:class I SAM-dependent rRNA methyltransferase [Anaerolineae bacterium]